MTIQEWGAIGEVVGGIAVVLTLAYLAVQIRQNTKAVRRSSHQSAVEAFTTANAVITQDSEMARIVNTGLQHPEELDPIELTRFERWVGSIHAHMENLFFQHRDGIIETERWKAYEASAGDFVAYAGFANYWMRCKHRYTPSYQRHVEGLHSSRPASQASDKTEG